MWRPQVDGEMMSVFLRRLVCFMIRPSFMSCGHTASRTLRNSPPFAISAVRMLTGSSLQPLTSPVPCQQLTPQVKVQVRGVVNVSKRRGKKKTVKAVAKRFHRTGSGKLKYWPAGKVHNMLSKSRNHRRRLRKPRYATKTQLKTLNKMISGW